MDIFHQVVRSLQLLCSLEELIGTLGDEVADLTLHQSHVVHGLNHITGTRLTFGTDHRRTLSNTAQGLAQVAGATDKGHTELCLINVIDIVSGGKHLTLVDVVDVDSLQDLSLGNVSDTTFSHHGDAYSSLNAFDHLRIAHTSHTACGTDICRNALQSHNGTGTGLFGDLCLLRGCYVHDHAALEHLCQVAVQSLSVVFHCFFSLVVLFILVF